jgi:hypothetical protein
MSYIERRHIVDGSSEFVQARIHGTKSFIDIDPFGDKPDCMLTNMNNKGVSGHGVTLVTGNVSRTFHIGTYGEAVKFYSEIKELLKSPWYWKQTLV